MKLNIIYLIIILYGISMAQTEQSEHWYTRVTQFNHELKSIPIGKVVFLGNSITEGFDLTTAFPESKPLNRGIGADHLDGVLERLDSSVVLLKPSQLFILIGINDIGRGDSDSLIITRYDTLVSKLRSELGQTDIFLTSILPTNKKWTNCPREKIDRINKEIFRLAEEHGCRWVNLYPLFANDEGYLINQYSDDGLHLNETGYNRWINELTKLGLK